MLSWIKNFSVLTACALTGALLLGQTSSQSKEKWVATWATSQEMAPSQMGKPNLAPSVKMPDFSKMPQRPSPNIPTNVEDQTLRMIVHTSIGGRKVRVELANAFDKDIVSIGGARVAVRTVGSSIDAATDRPLTFGGSAKVELRPGAVLLSDPVDLNIRPMSDLAVSLFVIRAPGTPANHTLGLHTSYVVRGDETSSPTLTDPSTTTAYMWLRSIDVIAPEKTFAIVCFGDSITDGYTTSLDKDQAWPALLAQRLQQEKGTPGISVLNEGISGNEVLRNGAGVSGLARFDRDVLAEPGVRWVILLEGINDINLRGQITGPGALEAEELIGGYRQLIARAHAHQIKIAGATLTPEAGVWLAGPVGEATRQKVNQWIRTSREFDEVIDFDAVMRDPGDPTRLRSDYDSGDHIHPNDLGNAAMAKAVPLRYFLTKTHPN